MKNLKLISINFSLNQFGLRNFSQWLMILSISYLLFSTSAYSETLNRISLDTDFLEWMSIIESKLASVDQLPIVLLKNVYQDKPGTADTQYQEQVSEVNNSKLSDDEITRISFDLGWSCEKTKCKKTNTNLIDEPILVLPSSAIEFPLIIEDYPTLSSEHQKQTQVPVSLIDPKITEAENKLKSAINSINSTIERRDLANNRLSIAITDLKATNRQLRKTNKNLADKKKELETAISQNNTAITERNSEKDRNDTNFQKHSEKDEENERLKILIDDHKELKEKKNEELRKNREDLELELTNTDNEIEVFSQQSPKLSGQTQKLYNGVSKAIIGHNHKSAVINQKSQIEEAKNNVNVNLTDVVSLAPSIDYAFDTLTASFITSESNSNYQYLADSSRYFSFASSKIYSEDPEFKDERLILLEKAQFLIRQADTHFLIDDSAEGQKILNDANILIGRMMNEESLRRNDWEKLSEYNIACAGSPIFNGSKSGRNARISGQYAEIFLKNPEFQWAGLAQYASHYVGWGLKIAELAKRFPEIIPETWGQDQIIGNVENFLSEGNDAVFQNIAWQFKVFEKYGFEKIKRLHESGDIVDDQFEAWKLIHSGKQNNDNGTIWEGNKKLVEYEQKHTLQKVYDKHIIFDFLSALVFSPVPGQWDLFTAPDFEDPYFNVGQIGNEKYRWDWIERSILPDWENALNTIPSEINETSNELIEEAREVCK